MNRYLVTSILLISASVANAEIYKCVKDGETTYQADPCESGGELMDIPLKLHDSTTSDQPVESALPAGPGLQELSTEQVDMILDQLKQEQEEAGTEKDGDPLVASCSGIRVFSMTPYTIQGTSYVREWDFEESFPYLPYRRRVVTNANHQCASMMLKLPGYYGDIFSTMDERLARRFTATLVDDTTLTGESAELPDGRVDTSKQYAIKVCFGASDIPIASISCK